MNIRRAEDSGVFIGWLRWNLFWDNTPFLNMLFWLGKYRNSGQGKEMLSHWEKQMKEKIRRMCYGRCI